MSEYTPTTEEVRRYWVGKWVPSAELEAQFDRWLAEVQRAAAEKAVDAFEDAVLAHIREHGTSTENWPTNPYRKGENDE